MLLSGLAGAAFPIPRAASGAAAPSCGESGCGSMGGRLGDRELVGGSVGGSVDCSVSGSSGATAGTAAICKAPPRLGTHGGSQVIKLHSA